MQPYTIAVLNFNGLKVLKPTLDALLKIPDEGKHIMVLDNGSTDGSREWIAETYPELALHLTADDGNVSRVRNYALEHAPTRYVMLCDNDLVLAPDCPRKLLEAMPSADDGLACTPRTSSPYRAAASADERFNRYRHPTSRSPRFRAESP